MKRYYCLFACMFIVFCDFGCKSSAELQTRQSGVVRNETVYDSVTNLIDIYERKIDYEAKATAVRMKIYSFHGLESDKRDLIERQLEKYDSFVTKMQDTITKILNETDEESRKIMFYYLENRVEAEGLWSVMSVEGSLHLTYITDDIEVMNKYELSGDVDKFNSDQLYVYTLFKLHLKKILHLTIEEALLERMAIKNESSEFFNAVISRK